MDGPAAGAQVYDEEGREGAHGRNTANCRIGGVDSLAGLRIGG